MKKSLLIIKKYSVLLIFLFSTSFSNMIAQNIPFFGWNGDDNYVNIIQSNWDCTILASAGSDKIIKLWNASTGELIKSFSGHTGRINSLAFSNSGDILTSGGKDSIILIWDVRNEKLLKTLEKHFGSVNYISFSPLGDVFASAGGFQYTIKFWDPVNNYSYLKTLTGDYGDDIESFSFSPDGKKLAAGGRLDNISIVDISTNQFILKKTVGDLGVLHSISYSKNGNYIAGGGRYLYLLDLSKDTIKKIS